MAFSWVDPDPSYMELHVLSVIPDAQTEKFVIDDIPCPISAIRFWVDEVLERNRDMMIGWTMEDQNIWIHSFRVFLKKMVGTGRRPVMIFKAPMVVCTKP